jgi:hypothetical protein
MRPGGERNVWLDRASLCGMAVSVGVMLQPWWSSGLRVGFFLTALFTVLQIAASHVRAGEA